MKEDVTISIIITAHNYGRYLDECITSCLQQSIQPHQKNMLGPRQQEAFAEVMRISKNALLSFPYKWNQPGNVHHGIDENKINVWTLGVEPKKVEKSGTRILYLFNFES